MIFGKTHLAGIEGTSIIIGTYCLFSSDIIFRTSDSHSILNKAGERINYSKSIEINDHVWFGNKTTINKDSIVATGAIVTRQFNESNVILVGIPAAIIKKEVNWDINRL